MSLVKLLLSLIGIELKQRARKVVADAIAPEEDPFPLTMRDVQHQQDQIRQATAHGSGEHRIERKTILPPER